MYFSVALQPPHGTIPVDVGGSDVDVEVLNVSLVFDKAAIDAIADAFDPSSATSPPAAECRAIARPIVEAILAARVASVPK